MSLQYPQSKCFREQFTPNLQTRLYHSTFPNQPKFQTVGLRSLRHIPIDKHCTIGPTPHISFHLPILHQTYITVSLIWYPLIISGVVGRERGETPFPTCCHWGNAFSLLFFSSFAQ